MREGDISLAIEIPPGFARDIARGRRVEIGAWIDGAMPMRAETISGYVQGMHNWWIIERTRELFGDDAVVGDFSLETRFRYNPDLESLETFGRRLEEALRDVPEIRGETVFAERVVGKPYLEVVLDREAIGRFGLRVEDVQRVLSIAVGGMPLTRTVEGRERFAVRVRYMREERDSIEALRRVMVAAPGGAQIPLEQLAEIRLTQGPQMIRSEDTFPTSYVLFDRRADVAEVDAVEAAQAHLARLEAEGRLERPTGVSYAFAGTYQAQLRSEEQLSVLIPVALSLVLLLLYLQFRRVSTTLIIYTGVAVAVSGGFILLWLYDQPWFLDLTLFEISLRELFQVGTVNLSMAVWVGVIALIGVATDDGVVMSTYLKQRFDESPAPDEDAVRARVLEAGLRRVRPCLMTTATTILALVPVLTSQGRGADVMVPMALPSVGGMAFELVTLFVVPVLYCWVEELRVRRDALPSDPGLADRLGVLFPLARRSRGSQPEPEEETPT